jgi:hypothetical protein
MHANLSKRLELAGCAVPAVGWATAVDDEVCAHVWVADDAAWDVLDISPLGLDLQPGAAIARRCHVRLVNRWTWSAPAAAAAVPAVVAAA